MKKQISKAIENVSTKLNLQKEEEDGIREIAQTQESVLTHGETLG